MHPILEEISKWKADLLAHQGELDIVGLRMVLTDAQIRELKSATQLYRSLQPAGDPIPLPAWALASLLDGEMAVGMFDGVLLVQKPPRCSVCGHLL